MDVSRIQESNRPLFVEIFAGKGSLSRAMVQAGFSVLSLDHENNGAVVPLVMLDLTTPSGVKILWDILASPSLMAIHLGLPCGTASRARDRPVALLSLLKVRQTLRLCGVQKCLSGFLA